MSSILGRGKARTWMILDPALRSMKCWELQVGPALYRIGEITKKVSLKTTEMQVLRLALLAQDGSFMG